LGPTQQSVSDRSQVKAWEEGQSNNGRATTEKNER
jgi:hypothetical protein